MYPYVSRPLIPSTIAVGKSALQESWQLFSPVRYTTSMMNAVTKEYERTVAAIEQLDV